jgi:hypothetical protein
LQQKDISIARKHISCKKGRIVLTHSGNRDATNMTPETFAITMCVGEGLQESAHFMNVMPAKA